MNKTMAYLFIGALLAPAGSTHAARAAADASGGAEPASAEALEVLPISFEPNVGQAGEEIKFVARARGYTALLSDGGAVLSLAPGPSASPQPGGHAGEAEEAPAAPRTLRLRWAGSSQQPEAEGELEGKVNYLVGDEPALWRTDVPTFARVRYPGVYPGVDLVFYGNGRNLEYDFVVAPGADPRDVSMEFEGADGVRLDDGGDLVIAVGGGEVRQLRPVAYQRDDEGGRRPVPAAYSLDAAGRARLDLGAYDAGRELVVDPVLVYSTYLGGPGSDTAQSVTLDSNGAAYVVGHTSSPWPTTAGAYDTVFNGATDAFVTKLSPNGAGLVFSTYLGGLSRDLAYDVARDPGGNIYVVGYTGSRDFPTTAGAFDTVFNGGSDAFVTKLNPMGNALVYSTFLGSASSDRADSIALDTAGSAFVTGTTSSPGFPVTAGAFDPGFNGGTDVFVTKLNPVGAALVYSTFLGGAGNDGGEGIALDFNYQAYVTGHTQGLGFPIAVGAFDPAFNGAIDAFVTKLNVAGNGLIYSTFLGGANNDYGADIAVATSGAFVGQAYVVGYTQSPNYPVTMGAYDVGFNGGYDAFVTALNAAGAGLFYSTFVGSGGQDYGRGIALDGAGSAHFTGSTTSPGFPTTAGTIDPTFNGVNDAFAARLNVAGAGLLFSTFLGSPGDDGGYGVARGPGAMVVAGYTSAAGFPTTAGVVQPAFGGARDAFVTKVMP
jgi:hypothetical protein